MGSYSSTIMKDQRVMAEEALVVAAPESVLTMPRSVAVGMQATVGDIIFHEFPVEAQQSISELVEMVESSQKTQVEALQAQQQAQQRVIPEITKTIAQGQASVLPEIAKYILIAVAVIVVAGRFAK